MPLDLALEDTTCYSLALHQLKYYIFSVKKTFNDDGKLTTEDVITE